MPMPALREEGRRNTKQSQNLEGRIMPPHLPVLPFCFICLSNLCIHPIGSSSVGKRTAQGWPPPVARVTRRPHTPKLERRHCDANGGWSGGKEGAPRFNSHLPRMEPWFCLSLDKRLPTPNYDQLTTSSSILCQNTREFTALS